MRRNSVVKLLLLVPIVLISLSLARSILLYPGSGTFHADTYYIPLRQFVAEEEHRAMEEEVIRIYNAEQRRGARWPIVRDVICLGCLLLARFQLGRSFGAEGG